MQMRVRHFWHTGAGDDFGVIRTMLPHPPAHGFDRP